ncbi:serine hydroxymethyltransferase [Cognatiyoonia sp. IB215182]|uniref:serine hydroxymethyltransferase n=1 Tax=Cognatiyoonia sp. IB215182 TaxID=3097353 RepID=UPI002A0BB3F6|nr:serine hydroxymethyltransferase [Cognatiyoonia sp. IB215182]MDX8355493.1 serine hydroxymethyltransferase [Cognatiyoonia sp. IB215182]
MEDFAELEKSSFFYDSMKQVDPAVFYAIEAENQRQNAAIEMIAPKNYLSAAVRQGVSSIMSMTSIEGYPGKRYHAGVQNIDTIEQLAIDRAKEMFGASHANVQPNSGTQANQAVFFALLQPDDPVLSLGLSDGGHLSHGLKSNVSGKWFDPKFYRTNCDGLIDYAHMEKIAAEHCPKLIIVGGSSYPRTIDFPKVAEIARKHRAKVLADVSHFSGLIVSGCYPNPFPHVDVITTTTNKNLRGPRGGLILTKDPDMAKKIDSAVFPGIQGGPLPEMITGKAIAFGEALTDDFQIYGNQVVKNARKFATTLMENGISVVSDGTDTPLIMVDLRPLRLTGDVAQSAFEDIGLTCNRNLVPFDPEKPNITSGLRFGTSAVTTRGMHEPEMVELGTLVADVLKSLPMTAEHIYEHAVTKIRTLSDAFPIYPR